MAAENDTKMDGKSLDITKENIAALKQLFPEIVEEGKIDFDKLKTILGEEVDSDDERYNFTWHGKNQAIRMSQTPSMGTLRPCKEESVDWDTTQNLYIEGDNLEVLKLLQKSYFGKVKTIYIDPPYNTGKDFVYPDNYSDNITNYKQITKQTDCDGNNINTNPESDGRFHTNWLNMIYPRLKIARNLLTDDGVLFVSIDDKELSNTKKICDEIFGEYNFESLISWRRRTNQPNDKTKMVAKVTDYILVYAKSSDMLSNKGSFSGIPLSEERVSEYKNPDKDINGPWSSNPWKAAVGRGGTKYSITTPGGTTYDETWYGSEETFNEHLSQGRVYWTDGGRGMPRIKIYLSEALKTGQAAINFFTPERHGSNQEGSAELERLMGSKGLFDNPKPTKLLRSLIQISTDENSIVLDFFAGSSSFADAVLKFNEEFSSNIHFILVQLPENLDDAMGRAQGSNKETIKNTIDFLNGIDKPHNICEIGKERIRRVGNEMRKNQSQTKIDDQKEEMDVGFKVFKLDASNIKMWNPSVDVKQTLLDYENNIVSDSGRTDLDIMYEVMLKMGLELTSKIDVIHLSGTIIYSISSGALMVCLDDIKDTSVAEKMISIHKEQNPFVWKVVFKDNGFASDDVKANTRETLKMAGLPEGSFVTL